MFDDDAIRHLYALTPNQREQLLVYLFVDLLFPSAHQRRTVVPTPVRGCDPDNSGPSSSWDIIVRLYENA